MKLSNEALVSLVSSPASNTVQNVMNKHFKDALNMKSDEFHDLLGLSAVA